MIQPRWWYKLWIGHQVIFTNNTQRILNTKIRNIWLFSESLLTYFVVFGIFQIGFKSRRLPLGGWDDRLLLSLRHNTKARSVLLLRLLPQSLRYCDISEDTWLFYFIFSCWRCWNRVDFYLPWEKWWHFCVS